MAKQRFGINDGYRGTVGTVIGYQWRGKWCLRARPRFVHNPRTEVQQRNRMLFKEVVLMASTLRSALHKGLHVKALEAQMTECNYFYHRNKACFSLEEGRLAVDYENLQVSEGPVAPVGFGEPEGESETLTVPFEKNPLHARAGSDDEVRLLAVCMEMDDMRMSPPAYRRSKSVSITLPTEWEGKEVHLYGFVTDYEGRASASTYIGVLMNGLSDEREADLHEELALEDVTSHNPVVWVVSGLEGGAVAHDELGVGAYYALSTAKHRGDELLE